MKKVTKEARKLNGKNRSNGSSVDPAQNRIIRRGNRIKKISYLSQRDCNADVLCEATRDLKLADVKSIHRSAKTTVKVKGQKACCCTDLRAGLGMVDGMLAMIPRQK